MGNIRDIRIISSTRTGVKNISSSVETWGQLKDSISDFGDLSKMTAVVKETRVTLDNNEALLPEGTFTVYLSPKQIKAGSGNSVEIITALRDKLNSAFDELIEEIEDGNFDDDDDDDDLEEDYYPVAKSSAKATKKESDLTASDREFLASLKGV